MKLQKIAAGTRAFSLPPRKGPGIEVARVVRSFARDSDGNIN